jgi:rod shape-determining protein MreD
MKNWPFILVIFFLALFQVTCLESFQLLGAKPDLFLISVVLAAFYFPAGQALLISLSVGLLKDVFAVNNFGLNSLLLPLLCFLLIQLNKRLSVEYVPILALITFAASLFYASLSRLVFHYQNNFILYSSFWRIGFLTALYTALILPLVLKLINKAVRS